MKRNFVILPMFALSLISIDMPSIKQNAQNRLQEKVEERAQEMKTDFQDNLDSSLKSKGVVRKGTVTAISGTEIKVQQGVTEFSVETTTETKFRHRFGGISQLNELKVGNIVDVRGVWMNGEKNRITARFIRNLSIDKRFGVFFGDVVAVSASGVVISTPTRGTINITISDSTKIVNRKMQNMEIGDFKVGDRIRIKGMWDKTSNMISEITEIKNFTQPVVSPTSEPEV